MLGTDGNDITDPNNIGNLNPFRYRGYFYDVETGLYYLKSRYYDPEIGRFITIDGIEYLDPKTINGLNLYAYCGNNPVMYTDPNGTAKWWEWLLGIVIIIGAVALSVVTAGLAAPISAALGGGLAGAIVGGAVAGAIGGAITGFAFSVASQGISNGFDNIDWQQVGFDTAIGFVVGGLLGAIGGWAQYASNAGRAAAKSTKEIGNYLLKDANGTVRYTGIGSKERMLTSLREKGKIIKGLTAEFRPAPNRIVAYAREAMYINEFGGAVSMNKFTNLLNKINSPGLKYLFLWF